MEYALDYCYVQNTYFIGFYEYKPENYFDIAQHVIEIPKNVTERDQKQIGEYTKLRSSSLYYWSLFLVGYWNSRD